MREREMEAGNSVEGLGVEPTGLRIGDRARRAIPLAFADDASRRAFREYRAGLHPDSPDARNIVQLERSDIPFVIEVGSNGHGNDGSLTYDGSRVLVRVDPPAPDLDASLASRFAHEIQHAIQLDKGRIGFRRIEGRWVPRATDVLDEVEAFEAQLRQASRIDLRRGLLRGYRTAKDRAQYLIKNGYATFRNRRQRVDAPKVEGYEAGQIFRDSRFFHRIPG